jgi:hypothetical protein
MGSLVVEILLKDTRGRAEPCGPKAVDPSTDNQYTIRWASQKGYSQVVETLLKDSRGRAEPCGPKAVDPSAYKWTPSRSRSSAKRSKS